MYSYATAALAAQHRADQMCAAHARRNARGVARRPGRHATRLVLHAFGLFH
jgi:hypothetical protein